MRKKGKRKNREAKMSILKSLAQGYKDSMELYVVDDSNVWMTNITITLFGAVSDVEWGLMGERHRQTNSSSIQS